MFLVIEMQTNGETTTALNFSFKDQNKAYEKYHLILAAAAVSSVEIHTAVILNASGFIEARETFEHQPETI